MESYAKRKVEWRKNYLIDKFIPNCTKILDLGCGPGQFGPFLKRRCKILIGLDMDKKLLEIAKKRGYDKIIYKKIGNKLPFKTKEIDCVWCSELLEHLPSLGIVNEIERITKQVIVLTMPNPLSPHFKKDKTHILTYSIGSLRKFFKKQLRWSYKIRGLGFDDIPLPKSIKKLTTFGLYLFPQISPTIAIIMKTREFNK